MTSRRWSIAIVALELSVFGGLLALMTYPTEWAENVPWIFLGYIIGRAVSVVIDYLVYNAAKAEIREIEDRHCPWRD